MNFYMQEAKKKRDRNYGENLIDIIQKHLSSKGYNFLRDQTLYNEKFSTSNKKRLPDLILGTWKKTLVKLIIEIDGNGNGKNVHGLDLEGATENTKSRNQDYERAGFNYLVLHVEELKENHLSFKKNSNEILGCISYLVSEKLNQIITRSQI